MQKGRILLCVSVILIAALLYAGPAFGEIQLSMTRENWKWQTEEINPFEGIIRFDDGFQEEVTLRLTMDIKPETKESGRIAFSSVNGKKLTLRNQKDTYVIAEGHGAEFSFSANWFLPDRLVPEAVIVHLTAFSSDGEILGSCILEGSSYNSGETSGSDREIILYEKIHRGTILLFIVAGVLWIAGALRAIHHQGKGKERKKTT